MLKQAVATLSREDLTEDQRESEIATLVQDPQLARRLIDWLPEIFGLVLVPHINKVNLPTQFSARDARGRWVKINFNAEPLFAPALKLGTAMYHSDDRSKFGVIALRSATVDTVNKMLNAGHPLEGATLSGPALIGIPAETYLTAKSSWWRRLFT